MLDCVLYFTIYPAFNKKTNLICPNQKNLKDF
jgi:hypothetical protein